MHWLPDANVGSVTQQDAGLAVIRQVDIENLAAHALTQELVAQRHQNFDTLVEIARHPVGAADIDFFFAAIAEVVDPAVLQKTSHNAAYADAVAQAAHTRTQRANPAHDEINLHPGLGGAIQR